MTDKTTQQKKSSLKIAFTSATLSSSIQTVKLVLNFAVRYILIEKLSIEYLGIFKIYSDIFLSLSLVELGITPALNFAMYKPIAKGDWAKVKALNLFQKKFYYFCSFLVLVIGLVFAQFLPNILGSYSNQNAAFIGFYLYLFGSSIGYLVQGKRPILGSDKRQHIVYLTSISIDIFVIVLQVILLLVFNLPFADAFIMYMVIRTIGIFVARLTLMLISHKIYKFIDNEPNIPLDKEDFASIKKQAIGVIFLEGFAALIIAINGSLLSLFLGVAIVGIYANYNIIITGIGTVLTALFSSLVPSFGQKFQIISRLEAFHILKKYTFVILAIGNIGSTILLVCMNPLIRVWVGEKYLLSDLFTVLIATNMFFLVSTYITKMAITAYGLQWRVKKWFLVSLITSIFITFSGLYFLNLKILSIVISNIIGSQLVILIGIIREIALYMEIRQRAFWRPIIFQLIQFLVSSTISLALLKVTSLFVTNSFLEMIIAFILSLSTSICVFMVSNKNDEDMDWVKGNLIKVIRRKSD